MNGASSDVWYWLNSNFLVLSEGIEIKKKSLFHILFYMIEVFFVPKEWKQLRQ